MQELKDSLLTSYSELLKNKNNIRNERFTTEIKAMFLSLFPTSLDLIQKLEASITPVQPKQIGAVAYKVLEMPVSSKKKVEETTQVVADSVSDASADLLSMDFNKMVEHFGGRDKLITHFQGRGLTMNKKDNNIKLFNQIQRSLK